MSIQSKPSSLAAITARISQEGLDQLFREAGHMPRGFSNPCQ